MNYWATLTCGYCADSWPVKYKVWHSLTVPRFTKKAGGCVVKCPKCRKSDRVRILSKGDNRSSELRSDF